MDDSVEEDSSPRHYRRQKDTLYSNYNTYQADWHNRISKRSLNITQHIDYIQIAFLAIFSSDLAYKYQRNFGLKVVRYSNFNQNVLFAIVDRQRFNENFVTLLNIYFQSPADELPIECKLLTLIHSFECLTSDKIAPYIYSQNIILHFVDNTLITQEYSIIKKQLLSFLQEKNIDILKIDESLLQISDIDIDILQQIIDNFDIVQSVQALRTLRIRPNLLSGTPELVLGLDVHLVPNSPTIGIIDTGIAPIDIMQKVIERDGLDLTNSSNPEPYSIKSDHGTTVAALASFGWDFFNNPSNKLSADAKVFSIKAQSEDTGVVNLAQIANAIKQAYESYNIRIFNLSLNVGCKEYNSEISDYAYVLDQLAYNNDILIFISTGNLSIDDVVEIQRICQDINTSSDTRRFLTYPNHFYNPQKESEVHLCVCSNLCEPAESMNNITVGALADNLRKDGIRTDLSLGNEYPAFYTRKYHIDNTQKINNTRFKNNQINKNLFKPDLVLPGGDLLSNDSKMQVIGVEYGALHYLRSSGTSYAAPLAANMAAKILGRYPQLKMQTVKAILINSANEVEFGYLNELIDDLKQQNSPTPIDDLTQSEKTALTKKYNAKRLNHYLTGHGVPDIDKCLYSGGKRVCLIIEESIQYDSHKVINLNIPKYLYDHPKKVALKITATLCYKFPPVLDNPLSYNPVHISFNIGNSILKNDPTSNAREYAECQKVKDNERIAIKKNFFSWSDDFFPASSKLFSNVQKFSVNIAPSELIKIDGQVSIIVRCTGRHDPILAATVQKSHEFSIAFCIEEIYTAELKERDLYSELDSINVLEIATHIDSEAELDNKINN